MAVSRVRVSVSGPRRASGRAWRSVRPAACRPSRSAAVEHQPVALDRQAGAAPAGAGCGRRGRSPGASPRPARGRAGGARRRARAAIGRGLRRIVAAAVWRAKATLARKARSAWFMPAIGARSTCSKTRSARWSGCSRAPRSARRQAAASSTGSRAPNTGCSFSNAGVSQASSAAPRSGEMPARGAQRRAALDQRIAARGRRRPWPRAAGPRARRRPRWSPARAQASRSAPPAPRRRRAGSRRRFLERPCDPLQRAARLAGDQAGGVQRLGAAHLVLVDDLQRIAGQLACGSRARLRQAPPTAWKCRGGEAVGDAAPARSRSTAARAASASKRPRRAAGRRGRAAG